MSLTWMWAHAPDTVSVINVKSSSGAAAFVTVTVCCVCTFSAVRFHTVTTWPIFNRLETIPLPISPRPRNPILVDKVQNKIEKSASQHWHNRLVFVRLCGLSLNPIMSCDEGVLWCCSEGVSVPFICGCDVAIDGCAVSCLDGCWPCVLHNHKNHCQLHTKGKVKATKLCYKLFRIIYFSTTIIKTLHIKNLKQIHYKS